MASGFRLTPPRHVPPLDPGFRPAVLANRAFRADVAASGVGVPLVIGLERPDGSLSRYETVAFPDGHPRAEANLVYVERLVKFLLWQRGGWNVLVGGPRSIGEHVTPVYAADGERKFDHHFMGEQVHGRPFTVSPCRAGRAAGRGAGQRLGRHLDGCRIGFDLGASDLKVSARRRRRGDLQRGDRVGAGRADRPGVSLPRDHALALKPAASKMPRSTPSAAVRPASSSTTGRWWPRSSAASRRPLRRDPEMFLRFREEFGVPLEVVNDGDVTALAGAMCLDDNGCSASRMGRARRRATSTGGQITGWLNELAFAPVDYNPDGPRRRVVGRRGVGALYFSQQCVFRSPRRSASRSGGATEAEKLKVAQERSSPGTKAPRRSGRASACTWATASPTTPTSTSSGTC